MVDLPGDVVELLLNAVLRVVGEAEVIGLAAQADDLLRQSQAALAALGPNLAEGHIDAQFLTSVLHQLQLRGGVGGEGVDGHHTGQAVDLGDVLHMLEQVGQAPFQGGQVLLVQVGLGHAAVVFQRPDGGDNHHGAGGQARQAAFDVQKLLRPQIRAEARLGDGVIRQPQGHLRGHDGIAPVGDVGEGPAVDEGRGALQGLDQVGLQSVLQQGRHGALGLQVVGGDGPAVVGIGHHHPAKAGLQVGDVGGEAQHRHDLAGHGDVEAILPGHALHPAAQAVHDAAQLAVVHVHAALPGDALDIDAQGVALLDVVVQHGRAQIVGGADGVEVAGEVKIDVLHGHHLGIAAAGGAALDTEHGAERGLPQGHQGVLAQAAHGVRQAHGGGGLALAGGGGVDGGDQDQLAVGALALPQQAVVHLGLVIAVQLQIPAVHPGGLGDLGDGLHGTGLGDFDIGFEFHGAYPPQSCRRPEKRKRAHRRFSAPRRSAFKTLLRPRYFMWSRPTSVSHTAPAKTASRFSGCDKHNTPFFRRQDAFSRFIPSAFWDFKKENGGCISLQGACNLNRIGQIVQNKAVQYVLRIESFR